MTAHALLKVLLDTPEPSAGHGAILLSGEDWDIPIHDKSHTYLAIVQWRRYRFGKGIDREAVAKRLVKKAIEFGIVSQGLQIVKS